MMGARSRDSCREFFKILGILPLTAQYIRGLSRKYPAILNISRTGRVALM